jgi:hypothetical protein
MVISHTRSEAISSNEAQVRSKKTRAICIWIMESTVDSVSTVERVESCLLQSSYIVSYRVPLSSQQMVKLYPTALYHGGKNLFIGEKGGYSDRESNPALVRVKHLY